MRAWIRNGFVSSCARLALKASARCARSLVPLPFAHNPIAPSLPHPPCEIPSCTNVAGCSRRILLAAAANCKPSPPLPGRKQADMHLSDLPLHDGSRELLLMSESNSSQGQLLLRLERISAELALEQAHNDELLLSMLPREVVADLRRGRRVRGQDHPAATVLFSDIVGFTNISQEATPCQVCDMLDELYTVFDTLSTFFDIYKVETIGTPAHTQTRKRMHRQLILPKRSCVADMQALTDFLTKCFRRCVHDSGWHQWRSEQTRHSCRGHGFCHDDRRQARAHA